MTEPRGDDLDRRVRALEEGVAVRGGFATLGTGMAEITRLLGGSPNPR